MIEITDPAFNYEMNGDVYSYYRKADPGIAKYINEALGSAKTVLNVGAGAGSYEPADKYVISVEPSSVMRSQRLSDKVPGLIAKADNLPFDDKTFDASMALVTVHHWPDMEKGLLEMRRVTRNKVIIMTFDPRCLYQFWNYNYFPELIEIERKRYPEINFLTEVLGGSIEIIKIPIPFDCTDGFQEAFYGRPEAFLNKNVRKAQSAWGFLPEETENKYVKALSDDLSSGEWDKKYGYLRNQPFFTCALRLVISKQSG